MAAPAEEVAPPKKKSTTRLLVIIIALVVALAGIATYFVFFRGEAQPLVASFSSQVDLLQVRVNASRAEGSIASYSWDFGDGSTASGQEATHSYSQGGQYTVNLTITDGSGRSASSSQRVSVDPTSTIFVRMYDFCEPILEDYWKIRRGTYGDKIIRNEPPAVNQYPWGFDEGLGDTNTALFCLYRLNFHGVNVPNYNMSEPVFFPYMARFDAKPSAKGSPDNTGQPLANLLSEDGTRYVVGPGQTMWLDSFDLGGHGAERVWSAALEVRYATDAGIQRPVCTDLLNAVCFRWSLEGKANESVALRIRDTGGPSSFVTDWLTLSPAVVPGWGPIGPLNVSLKNPSPDKSVYIDALRITVFYASPPPATPVGEMTLNWRLNYATAASHAEWASLGYIDVSGQDDGFVTDLRGTFTMDYETSQRIFGVTGDPAQWWARVNAEDLGYGQARTSAVEAAWANWFEWNGNVKYDVFNGFEWFFQIFFFELNGTVVQQGGTNQTVVNFGIVTWGMEVLLSRWFYWGGASYVNETGADGLYNTPDDIPAVPRGWYGQEVGWWEHAYFNATIGTSLDFDYTATLGYQAYFGADPGPDGLWKTSDDEPTFGWMANLIDYVYDPNAHPRGEMSWYIRNGLTYIHSTPGSFLYGEEFQYDNTFVRWHLRRGETIVIELPRTPMIWFDPVRSTFDPAAEGGKGGPVYTTFFAPLVLKRMEPADVGLWDEASNTLSMVGPFQMPDDGNPPLQGYPSIVWKPAS